MAKKQLSNWAKVGKFLVYLYAYSGLIAAVLMFMVIILSAVNNKTEGVGHAFMVIVFYGLPSYAMLRYAKESK